MRRIYQLLLPQLFLIYLPAGCMAGTEVSLEPDCMDGDPMCGPWEPVLNANNEMTIGFNTYLGIAIPSGLS